MDILKTVMLFVVAGLAEIGGGYLIWLWLRESKSVAFGIVGGIILILYGIIPTLQPTSNFGRIYAAYGGIFIVLSLFWGWGVENKMPDLYDWTGMVICLVGVSVMMWAPGR